MGRQRLFHLRENFIPSRGRFLREGETDHVRAHPIAEGFLRRVPAVPIYCRDCRVEFVVDACVPVAMFLDAARVGQTLVFPVASALCELEVVDGLRAAVRFQLVVTKWTSEQGLNRAPREAVGN